MNYISSVFTQSDHTFIHVLGESVEDPRCRRGVKELHRAAKNLLQEFIMKPRRGTQSSLTKKNVCKYAEYREPEKAGQQHAIPNILYIHFMYSASDLTQAHLDEDDASDEFKQKHNAHGHGVDSSVVLHQWVVPHAVTHHRAVPHKHSGVLHM